MLELRNLRVIIPACNERARIEPTIRDYCTVFRDCATVLVVTNGCTDGTPDLVESLQREFLNLELIEIGGRIGKGGAVRVGLWTGSEDFIGFVDADGSTSACEFLRLFEALRSGDADAVIGSRWCTGASVEPRQPFARRLASRIFNALVRILFGLPFSDTQCGAKIFTRRAIAEIYHSLEVANFAFDIEVLWRLKRASCKVIELATIWADRQHGTKVRLGSSSLTMLASVLRLRFRESSLWLVPFVDRFANKGVIPVVDERRILVLGASIEHLRTSAQFAEFFDALGRAGFTLSAPRFESRVGAKSPLHRPLGVVRLLGWYIFASHRDYDAIIEAAGFGRSWIPAFSLKPSFVVSACERSADASGQLGYVRSSFIDLQALSADEAARTVLAVQSGAVTGATFYSRADTVAFDYLAQDGALKRHVLRR